MGKNFYPRIDCIFLIRTLTIELSPAFLFFVDHTRFSRCKRRKVKLNEKVLCKEEKCTKHTFANHTYIDRFLPFRFFLGVVCFLNEMKSPSQRSIQSSIGGLMFIHSSASKKHIIAYSLRDKIIFLVTVCEKTVVEVTRVCVYFPQGIDVCNKYMKQIQYIYP